MSPFLTALDDRAAVKGSRDPLGLVPIWSRFGREVVGNLTTVTTSVRGFTTLLLGLYLAEAVQQSERGAARSALELFLMFEQLAGYARVKFYNDHGVRGFRRIRARLDDSKRVRISAAQADQILSNQKVYGLWGLFSMAGRASDLLLPREQRLTPAARAFVEKRYLPALSNGSRSGRNIIDLLRRESFDFEPEGRHAATAEALAKVHARRLTADEKSFYWPTLACGGSGDTTHGRQEQLADILGVNSSEEFGFADFRAVKRSAEKRRNEALVSSLERIEVLEHLLMPARVAFGFLLTRNGQTVDYVVKEIASTWRRPPRLDRDRLALIENDIAHTGGSAASGRRWIQISDALSSADYETFIRLLVEVNTDVMQTRNGSAPWLTIEQQRLRVRMADESEQLLPAATVEELWRSTYFVNALWAIAREVA